MHVLIVLDHPDPASFSRAAAARFAEGAEASGHEVEWADLHAEGFDPRWTVPDLAQFQDKPMPDDVLAEQARVDRADAICLVFPLFWWGMPAMTKGWIDRVWSWGWAYDEVLNQDHSLQRPRTGIFLVPAGAAPHNMAEQGYDRALETAWLTGTMGYLGFRRKQLEILHGSMGSAERRAGLLDRAYRIGAELLPPV